MFVPTDTSRIATAMEPRGGTYGEPPSPAVGGAGCDLAALAFAADFDLRRDATRSAAAAQMEPFLTPDGSLNAALQLGARCAVGAVDEAALKEADLDPFLATTRRLAASAVASPTPRVMLCFRLFTSEESAAWLLPPAGDPPDGSLPAASRLAVPMLAQYAAS